MRGLDFKDRNLPSPTKDEKMNTKPDPNAVKRTLKLIEQIENRRELNEIQQEINKIAFENRLPIQEDEEI
jgi:hypothetical protein